MVLLIVKLRADPIKELCATYRPAGKAAGLGIGLPVIESLVQVIARVRNILFTVTILNAVFTMLPVSIVVSFRICFIRTPRHIVVIGKCAFAISDSAVCERESATTCI